MNLEDIELRLRKAYERALLRAYGISYEALGKPRLVIVNSWNEHNPGLVHLRLCYVPVIKSFLLCC